MSDQSKSILVLRNRTALHLLQWMQERGLEFRSGFSHPNSDHVVRQYIAHCLQEEAKDCKSRQGVPDNGGTKDTWKEDQNCA